MKYKICNCRSVFLDTIQDIAQSIGRFRRTLLLTWSVSKLTSKAMQATVYAGRYDWNASYIFSENATTILIKFTYIVCISFTRQSLVFHKLFIINRAFSTFTSEVAWQPSELFAASSEFLMQAVFVARKMASSELILQGRRKCGSHRELYWDCRTQFSFLSGRTLRIRCF